MQAGTRTRIRIRRRREARRPEAAADNFGAEDSPRGVRSAATEGSGAAGPRSSTSLPYRGGLDGLRAVAVAAVVLADTGAGGLPGGFLAIEVLFVLSGFLLTSLLLVERRTQGHVHLVRFWARRARRALPELLTVVGGVSIAVLALRPPMLAALGADVRAALVGVSNWQLIAVSGAASPLRHLWSVAVGAQFVVWWPVVFSVLLSRLGRRRLRAVVLLLALASAVGMGLVSLSGNDTRALYGTDTRASGLLLGALVALAFQPSAWQDRATGARARRLRIFGLAVLAALFAVVVAATPHARWVPRGGLFVVAMLTALVIAVVLRSAELDRMLGVAPLRWLGRRANGIYLWHWPVLVVIGARAVATRPPLLALYLAATVALAALTNRFVVRPLSRPRTGDDGDRTGRSGLAAGATAVACGVATVVALLTG
jgi:peptidoglycan/LPS O-acetylase OafA/YrhL